MDQFDSVRETVTTYVDQAHAVGNADPESSHAGTDSAAEAALAWVAENSACPQSREIALMVTKLYSAGYEAWYA